MIYRKEFDELLPDNIRSRKLVESMIGISADLPSADFVLDGLYWAADLCERDRHASWTKYDWQQPEHPLYNSYEPVWRVSTYGLSYKDSGSYLTAEGWPLGTKCWFMPVNCGWRIYCCGETPQLAVLRGIVIMTIAIEQRELAPKLRQGMHSALIQRVMEFKYPA